MFPLMFGDCAQQVLLPSNLTKSPIFLPATDKKMMIPVVDPYIGPASIVSLLHPPFYFSTNCNGTCFKLISFKLLITQDCIIEPSHVFRHILPIFVFILETCFDVGAGIYNSHEYSVCGSVAFVLKLCWLQEMNCLKYKKSLTDDISMNFCDFSFFFLVKLVKMWTKIKHITAMNCLHTSTGFVLGFLSIIALTLNLQGYNEDFYSWSFFVVVVVYKGFNCAWKVPPRLKENIGLCDIIIWRSCVYQAVDVV